MSSNPLSSSSEEVKKFIEENIKGKIKKRRHTKKPFPKDASIDDILKSLPQEVFTQDRIKAYGSLGASIGVLALSIYLLANTPWYLWPVGWMLGGAAIVGLFSIGHDCLHQAFAKSKLANDIMGTILMLPLGYSFESFRTQHKYKHNKHQSTASSSLVDTLWSWAKGSTFWLASIAHWAEQHVNIAYYKPEDRMRVRMSNYGVYAFAVVFFCALFWMVGFFGIIKYWALPMLGYHILMSTTTLLPAVVLKEDKTDSFIINCEFPRWFDFLTNDITLMVPRSISTSIPHYRLREAYKYIKSQWGDYILDMKFEWELLDDLINYTHNFDVRSYAPLSHHITKEVSQPCDAEGDIHATDQVSEGLVAWVVRSRNFFANINWMHAAILIPTPLIGLYGMLNYPLTFKTFVWSLVYYFGTGIGITAGYHRLWSHKAYSATLPLRIALLFLGAGAVEGSLRWWARDHRAHHRYTDTDKDPYDANRGFLYSHMGWMLVKQDPKKIGRSNIDDLNADPWIRWQHRHYLAVATFMGVIFPTLVAGIGWGDWMGGYFYAGVIRLVWVHHSTFMVNSLAHFWGAAPFADNHTPRDSIITALCTFGEGYHNFHHEFPYDYRNAIRFYQYDPTKWFILAMYYIGQAYDLKKFDDNVVKKGQVQMREKTLEKLKEKVDWGRPIDEYPVVNRQTFDDLMKEGHKLIIIGEFVHDATEFSLDHPGGIKILTPYIGKDATNAFKGGVYAHSNAAHNLLDQLRIGRVDKNDNWNFAPVVYDEWARTPIPSAQQKKSN